MWGWPIRSILSLEALLELSNYFKDFEAIFWIFIHLLVSSKSVTKSSNIGILAKGVLQMSSRLPSVRNHEAGKKGFYSQACSCQSTSRSRNACHLSTGCIWFHFYFLGLELELESLGDTTPVQSWPWKNQVRSKLVLWWQSQYQRLVSSKARIYFGGNMCSKGTLPCDDLSPRYLAKNSWRQVFNWAYCIEAMLVWSCFDKFPLRLPA